MKCLPVVELADRFGEIDPGSAAARTVGMGGYEGRAASIYWKAMTRLAPAKFGFEARITFRANDIANQCLNYLYGILYGEIWRALLKVGLDPYFGFVHGSMRNQGSLVFDLIEELRAPFADRLVFGMFGRGFKPEVGPLGFLRTNSRRQLALSFSKR
jgi:CRISP-associated protein Cas1